MAPEVVVVGGGPAGSVMAGLLAGQGVHVLLVDAAEFPRPKPCGECLNPGAVGVLARLGLLSSVTALQPVPLQGWRLVAGKRECTLDFPRAMKALAVDRQRLDHTLLQWAAGQGADIAQGTKVVDLVFSDGQVTGVLAAGKLTSGRRSRVAACMVVGADGLRSVVVRRLGLMLPACTAPKVALTAHWTGVDGLFERGELHFHAGAVCGIAPLGNGEANVSLVVSGPAARRIGKRQDILLARWPGLADRFEQARLTGRVLTTGSFDQPVKSVHGPGFVLVGDAAGYFDPLTGQGLFRALHSSALAGPAVMEALNGGTDALEAYQTQFRRSLWPAVRVQHWIDGLTRRPTLFAAGLGLLGVGAPLRRWLVSMTGDCPHAYIDPS